MVTDSTHVKAKASRASEYLVEVQEKSGTYWERLDRYEEEGLAELERRTGKRRKKRVNQIKRDKRGTHNYRETLKKRQIWCEGPFAIQKWGHNLIRIL